MAYMKNCWRREIDVKYVGERVRFTPVATYVEQYSLVYLEKSLTYLPTVT